ncbi:unnamed protein product [Euphydryas editha]|uniref:Uncharacterized protein n=1 Tax=Euphydryas editha TaxID=104508 RepID=A0AAU9U1V0_EUPED|nr:unnamed protein product [Euphydryas editha]
MALIDTLIAVIILMCVVTILAANLKVLNDDVRNSESIGRHLVKRSLEYEDGYSVFRPVYENAFEKPHRIRTFPGFLP